MESTALAQPMASPSPLLDRHRPKPKAQGGIYEPGNVIILEPPKHMATHDNLRIREERFEILKAIMDDRQQVMKTVMKINNQMLAYKRKTDHLNPETVAWLEGEIKRLKPDLDKRSRAAAKAVKKLGEVDPLVAAALGVRAIGPMTVAYCVNYLDLTKARHASSLWKYAGLHVASHERYTKGEASGGNKTLRAALFCMVESQIKLGGPYEVIYRRVKSRLEQSEKMVKSRNTQGKLVEVKWCDTKPCHRHGAAIRAAMKHFLADYWFVGRELLGLGNGACYADGQLGKTHKTIDPKDRGWKW